MLLLVATSVGESVSDGSGSWTEATQCHSHTCSVDRSHAADTNACCWLLALGALSLGAYEPEVAIRDRPGWIEKLMLVGDARCVISDQRQRQREATSSHTCSLLAVMAPG